MIFIAAFQSTNEIGFFANRVQKRAKRPRLYCALPAKPRLNV